MIQRTTKGFTLIELLVVIAIIGVLSSVVLASLNTARIRARDAQRVTTVRQIQSALELFYLTNGRYPGGSDVGMNAFNIAPHDGVACGYNNYWCGFETVLRPYIPALPRDTAGAFSGGGRYVYKSNPLRPDLYGLGVSMEGTNSAAANDGGDSAILFEVGPLVSYCKKYSGSSALWYNWDGNNLCQGGN